MLAVVAHHASSFWPTNLAGYGAFVAGLLVPVATVVSLLNRNVLREHTKELRDVHVLVNGNLHEKLVEMTTELKQVKLQLKGAGQRRTDGQ